MIPDDGKVETQIVADDTNGHYVLFSVGWEGTYREYAPFLHIDVKNDGKVWLQHDGTDQKIALWLFDAGIPKNQIVLGFHSEYSRQFQPDFALS